MDTFYSNTYVSLQERKVGLKFISLNQFLYDIYKRKKPEKRCEFLKLFITLQTIIKCTSEVVRRGNVMMYKENKRILEMVNSLFIDMLTESRTVCWMVSAESRHVITVPPRKRGKYIVCFSPLEGFRNVKWSLPCGTFFTIFKKQKRKGLSRDKEILQPGKEALAAGYALYSCMVQLVIAFKNTGASEFTLDPTLGMFVMTDFKIKIPRKGKIYCLDESLYQGCSNIIKEFISKCKDPKERNIFQYRRMGSLVSNLHLIVKGGGIIIDPEVEKFPKGQMKLLYEAVPMAFIVEEAGGESISGNECLEILQVVPVHIHDPIPIVIGSRVLVRELADYFRTFALQDVQGQLKEWHASWRAEGPPHQ